MGSSAPRCGATSAAVAKMHMSGVLAFRSWPHGAIAAIAWLATGCASEDIGSVASGGRGMADGGAGQGGTSAGGAGLGGAPGAGKGGASGNGAGGAGGA